MPTGDTHSEPNGAPTVGLMVQLTARPGREDDLVSFFRDAIPDAVAEPDTLTWMVVRSGPNTFYILDTFTDDDGRQTHIHGVIAERLREQGPNFLDDVSIVPTEVVAFMPSTV
ncbi:putative quinol monooxygenase [Euzebya tangerina]|uniref:putative quinol monooxygenase n=1 Tax=Euzebya tangerina TaxID=591198 RepID=UPI000E30D124|nr:antibiotic biosynthesis monooxygenase [Euzebya tangerina]